MRYLIFLFVLSILVVCGFVNLLIKNLLKFNFFSLLLEMICLLEGFKIEVFEDSFENVCFLCYFLNGIFFVGICGEGKVYVLWDIDGDFVVDECYILVEDLEMFNGVVFFDGVLYVVEVSWILKFLDIENKFDKFGELEVVYD